MNESWIDKSEEEIRSDITALAKQETGLTNFKSTGVLRGFLEVIIKIVVYIYQTAINSIYQNASLDGATGFFLSLWGLMLGVVRKQEGKTAGAFTGTSDGPGKIPAGAWAVLDGTDLRYRVAEDVSFEAGDFSLPVIAEFPGSRYNIGSGTPLRITRYISGLQAVAAGDNWITAVGQEVEADEPYRERIKTRWKEQSLGDTKDTYKFYAEEVTGVRTAKIIRAPRGPGSTDVVIAAVNGAPDEDLLDAVRANLHGHELMAFDVCVRAPELLELDVEIEYSGKAEEAEIRLIAETYIYGLSIGGRFKIADLYDRYRPLRLTTIEILSPDRDVQAETLYVVVGTITVRKTGE
ncbi:MAG: baseplate J/gp47 family protein [Treponema sp.]|jgi:uncharacterized phage protein gp47/JayE|nr:baseplate J/gp47 family protein [Treponema sp.]